MEGSTSGGTHPFYGPGALDLNGISGRGLQWDPNQWKWDGNLLVATPLNVVPSDCRNKQLFPVPVNGDGGSSSSSSSGNDDTDPVNNGKGKDHLENGRRDVLVQEGLLNEEAASLTLNLGKHVYPITSADFANGDGNNNKRSKVQAGSSNRAICQVEGCDAGLSGAKDYHRRHKVCEIHAKATKALVGNVMQRFCQQCSRFHLLEEFDEGKRSCRRRLAGHNRRRRKTNPDSVASGNALADDRASSYLLITLLKILSNLQANSSEQSKDPDLLSHFLKNVASIAGSFDPRNLSALLQASQDIQKGGNPAGMSSEGDQDLHLNGVTGQEAPRLLCSKINGTEVQESTMVPAIEAISAKIPHKGNTTECSLDSTIERVESTVGRIGLKNFDLNDVYDDGLDVIEESQKVENPANLVGSYVDCPWMLQESCQSSPPQTSGNSDSISAQSLVSSNGDAQGRTDRIVFKLFGKHPNDFPPSLRAQILDWLCNTPTDIEGYIRPGCVILTVYLHLAESTWEELRHNLSSSLRRLVNLDDSGLWKNGWVYVSVQHQIALIYNGQVVLDTPLFLNSHDHCRILSIKPIAVPVSEKVNFTVKGYNLARSTMRILCALEGKYLMQENTHALIDDTDNLNSNDGSQCLNFSCSLPDATGRGFVVVEDCDLTSTFFPFIVSEQDVCSEIRMLESIIDTQTNFQEKSAGLRARTHALDFLHEMGWLLRRYQLRSREDYMDSHWNVFPLARFKWLITYAMENEWCAVVKKLLDIFVGGIINIGDNPVELALAELPLLHNAVQNNSRPMVELLLRYTLDKSSGNTESQEVQIGGSGRFLFRPDMLGPLSLTPLHIASSRGDSLSVLDALTSDPGQVGLTAWKSARDSTGFTPEDYARYRGYDAYLGLIEKKANIHSGLHVIDIPGTSPAQHIIQKQVGNPCSSEVPWFEIDRSKSRMRPQCKTCSQLHLAYISRNRSSLLYRPAMLSLVGIAAVCVCVGLLLKSPPEILYVLPPFSWESLAYGSI